MGEALKGVSRYCYCMFCFHFMPTIIEMWTLYDHLFSSIFWCTGTVAIVINSYLLYLIFFDAPRTLRVYRVFLANVAIADLVFAAATTFAQIRYVVSNFRIDKRFRY